MDTELIWLIVKLVGGLIALILGGDFLVKGASRIALKLNVSELVVGLTIVAFGTSSPELFISVQAALKGSPDMTMGNVIGSNICNLALVLGLTAIITPVPIESSSIRLHWPVTMGSSLLLYAFVSGDNVLEGYVGYGFLFLIVVYVTYAVARSRMGEGPEEEVASIAGPVESVSESEKKNPLLILFDIGFILLGCSGLYFGSEYFVGGAEELFKDRLGFNPRIIGILVLAVGTSLPELITSVVAAFKKQTDIAVGGLMGSNIFNILSILGITAVITDIKVENHSIISYDMVWMLGVTALMLPMMIVNNRISRISGGMMLALYGYYVYTVFVA